MLIKPFKLFVRIACAGLLLCCGAPSPLYADDERPNFLWLTFEDTSSDELGCYGNPDVNTPVMDDLAKKGVRFTHAWSTAPHCSVSRSTLITGCYATTYNMDTHRYQYPQPKDIPLYPRFLSEAGYYCSNNYKTDYNIKDWDPTIWNECGDMDNYIGSYLHRKPGQPFFAVFNSMQTHMSRLTSVTLEGRRDFSKEGLDPAALRLPPHVPDRERVRSDLAFHLEGVQDVDTWIKRHLEILEENGLSEDTIIFVYSDHGGCLPRGKGWAYETGLRVPLIVYVPPKWQKKMGVTPGTVNDDLVSFVDLAPTLLSMAGIETPKQMQGRAFLGPYRVEPRRYQFGLVSNGERIYRPMRTVTDGRYKYIRNYVPYRADCLRNKFQWQMPGNLAWDDYLFGEKGDNEVWNQPKHLIKTERLFDIENDPYETKDLSADPTYAEKLAELRTQVQQHIRSTQDLGFFPFLTRHRDGSSLYEWVHNTGYDLEALYRAVEMASDPSREDIDGLSRLLTSDRPELRYWGAAGFAALGAKNVKVDIPDPLRAMLQDPNGEVAVTAAEAVALQGGHEAALQALIRLSENMDKENPQQFLDSKQNQRLYALASLEMLTTFEETVPLVSRYLELCHAGGEAGPYPFEVQALLVNLGRAPAATLYGNKTRREINTVRKPMGPLP